MYSQPALCQALVRLRAANEAEALPSRSLEARFVHMAQMCTSGLDCPRISEVEVFSERVGRRMGGARSRARSSLITLSGCSPSFLPPHENWPQAPCAASREAGWKLLVKGRWARASTLRGLDHPSHSTTFTGSLGSRPMTATAQRGRGRSQQSISLPRQHSVALPGTHFTSSMLTPSQRSPSTVLPGTGQHAWGAEPLQP